MGSEGPSKSRGRELAASIPIDWLEKLVWLSLVCPESEMEGVGDKNKGICSHRASHELLALIGILVSSAEVLGQSSVFTMVWPLSFCTFIL